MSMDEMSGGLPQLAGHPSKISAVGAKRLPASHPGVATQFCDERHLGLRERRTTSGDSVNDVLLTSAASPLPHHRNMAAQDTERLIYYSYKRWFFKSTTIQRKRPDSCWNAKEVAKEGFRDIGIWLSKRSVNIYCLKNKRKVYVTADDWNSDSFKGVAELYLEPRGAGAQLKQVWRNFAYPPKPKEGDGGGDGSQKSDEKDGKGGADLKNGGERG
ncbi:hypothetical protein C8R44DRAFT_854403 [Mycena epipterygia]|nr:hypothetical protein C8R44DRAFT_854403 [Mycena epipterygia]